MAKGASGKGKNKIKFGNDNSGANIMSIGKQPDKRQDIQKMFVDEIGFKGVLSTDKFDKAVIGAYGIALNGLERKFGVVKETGSTIAAGNIPGAYAAVAGMATNNMTLVLNRGSMGKIGEYVKAQRESQKSGYKMPTDGSVKSLARYTVTHEYGHMLQSAAYIRATKKGYNKSLNEYSREVAKEITSNAAKKYGGTQKDLSGYGRTNSYEVFAEAFANSQLGKPNAIGKATNDWLKKNGF